MADWSGRGRGRSSSSKSVSASPMEEHTKKLKGAREVPSRFREGANLKKKVVTRVIMSPHRQRNPRELRSSFGDARSEFWRNSVRSSDAILAKSPGPGTGLKRQTVEKKKPNLNSTGLEESMLMPSLNWDVSAMGSEYSAIEMPEALTTIQESTLIPSLSEEDLIEVHCVDALLFSYMAIMREKSLAKYQEQAERNLLLIEEENQRLRRKKFQQKQALLLQEKEKQFYAIVDQQIELLRPVVVAMQPFKMQYKSLGQALDTTRHSLQTKNIYVSEDPSENLEELKSHLKITKQLLDGLGFRTDMDNSKALAGIKELGTAVTEADTEMKRFFAKIEELSSCVSRETALLHQELDEHALGMEESAKGIFK